MLDSQMPVNSQRDGEPLCAYPEVKCIKRRMESLKCTHKDKCIKLEEIERADLIKDQAQQIEELQQEIANVGSSKELLELDLKELQARNDQLVEALETAGSSFMWMAAQSRHAHEPMDNIEWFRNMAAVALDKVRQALSNQPDPDLYKARQAVIDAAKELSIAMPSLRIGEAVTNLNTVMEKK